MGGWKQFKARIADIRMPGGYGGIGDRRGAVILRCVLVEGPSPHKGREVDVEIAPDQLETVQRMILNAIAMRGGREADHV